MPEPKIACIGVIGKSDNPLHMSLFPPYSDSGIEFSFLLNASLDVFEIRQKQTSIDQDLGLLHAVDERLASYGWLTTTGVKFLIIIDLIGGQTPFGINDAHESIRSNFRESDLKPAFRALQTAYIQLLQNPFYCPDDRVTMTNGAIQTSKPSHIIDQKFISEVSRIGSLHLPSYPSAAIQLIFIAGGRKSKTIPSMAIIFQYRVHDWRTSMPYLREQQ